MSIEEIIQRILSSRKDLTREEVLRRIEDKKEMARGYFTDETSARIVASELGVEISLKTFRPEVSIQDLVSGLNDVTLTGRVIIIYPLQTFTRPDATGGRVARLLIADKSGTLKVVLWDDKVGLVETGGIERGQIVRVSHGYVREGLDGKLELHVGLRGDIQVSPPDTVESKYPPIAQFIEKIAKVTRKHGKVSIVGVVREVHPTFEFERPDGTSGKVMRLRLRDESGEITAVLWNEKVDELGGVKMGDHLQIENARVKERLDGQLEVHVESATHIETLAETSPTLAPTPAAIAPFTKIRDLGLGMRGVDVLARVMHVEEVREFRRSNGEVGHVSALLIKDETGSVRLSLWEDKAVLSRQIRLGDIVLARGSYTRERFGEVNLNLGRQGSLTINPKIAEAERIPPLEEERTSIAGIKGEGGPITIEGTIITTPVTREVVTSQEQRVTVASFDLTDETGKIRASIWRGLAEAVRDLTIGTRIKIKNAYVKKGFSDQLELTSRKPTFIEVLSKSAKPPTPEE
ncbi:MAG: Replication factor A [Candidatus Bathyarchaeota archaeon BA1]|nr:MAG: Replication factor A [Candidatus Bathyarchaeota archaeon BA1]